MKAVMSINAGALTGVSHANTKSIVMHSNMMMVLANLIKRAEVQVRSPIEQDRAVPSTSGHNHIRQPPLQSSVSRVEGKEGMLTLILVSAFLVICFNC